MTKFCRRHKEDIINKKVINKMEHNDSELYSMRRLSEHYSSFSDGKYIPSTAFQRAVGPCAFLPYISE